MITKNELSQWIGQRVPEASQRPWLQRYGLALSLAAIIPISVGVFLEHAQAAENDHSDTPVFNPDEQDIPAPEDEDFNPVATSYTFTSGDHPWQESGRTAIALTAHDSSWQDSARTAMSNLHTLQTAHNDSHDFSLTLPPYHGAADGTPSAAYGLLNQESLDSSTLFSNPQASITSIEFETHSVDSLYF